MREPSAECMQFESELPIRQGDVFAWDHRDQEVPWRQHGIVITGDCDILKGKSREFLNYVPVLTAQQYIGLFWATAQLSKLTPAWVADLEKLIHRLQERHMPGTTPFSGPAILDRLLGRKSAAEILDLFRVTDITERQRFAKQAGQKLALLQEIQSPSFANSRDPARALRMLVAAYAAQNSAEIDKSRSVIGARAANYLENAPGDVFYLHELPFQASVGFVAMLRYIREIPHDSLAVTPGDALRQRAPAFRIGRMNAPYLYHLTQKLAAVFSDIGLPGAYELRRHDGASTILDDLEIEP